MSDDVVELNCCIFGDNYDRVFLVRIGRNDKVRHLKELIKEVKALAFEHKDVDAIKVWNVKNDILADDTDLHHKIASLHITNQQPLSPVKRISSVFASPIADDNLHIIVKPPLILNCFILGHEANEILAVKVSTTITVAFLQQAIKEQACQMFGIDCKKLDLWHVDIPVDGSLRQTLNATSITDRQPLSIVTPLDVVFVEPPTPMHLHIVVGCFSVGEYHQHIWCGQSSWLNAVANDPDTLLNQRKKIIGRKSNQSPSTLALPSNFWKIQKNDDDFYGCTCPSTRESNILLTLLHLVFGQFVEDSMTISPTECDYNFAQCIRTDMCEIYDEELKCCTQLCDILNKYSILVTPGYVPSSACLTDGHIVVGKHPVYIQELKNELGSQDAEPSLQALAYYDRFLCEQGLWQDTSTCHPCMIIYVVGPHIGFAGCAMMERSTLEVFLVHPLCFHSSNDSLYESLARHLAALQRAHFTLCDYYTELDARVPELLHASDPSTDRSMAKLSAQSRASMPSLMFPYQCTYREIHVGQLSSFLYDKLLTDRPLLFTAKADSDRVCIKFVRRYGRGVHAWCADRGFALKLIAYEELPGNWLMVVMEFLDETWTPLADIQRQDCIQFQNEIDAGLRALHEANMVHGDLRDTNIMVRWSGKPSFMLLDFDWARSAGQVMYPKFINKKIYPPYVQVGSSIVPEHDAAMVDRIFLVTS